MKVKFIFLVIILIGLVCIFNSISKNADGLVFKPLEIEIGEEFTNVQYNEPMYVLNYLIEDVVGNTEKDMIIIVGAKENITDTYSWNIDIVIYDTTQNTFIKCGLKKFEGNSPKLQVTDFTGDGSGDIIAISENEDLTKNVRIITIINGECKEIFREKDNKGIGITGRFLDGFKAHLTAKKIKFETDLDLTDKKENYIANGFYDEAGRVIADNKEITTSNFTNVDIIEINEQSGLMTKQRIKGFDNLDILDQITITWKYEDGAWKMKEAYGTTPNLQR